MPGSVYQVKAGSPQQLSGASIKGSVVWNNDLANSVWLSSVQAMGPDNGIELPPQAYCDWVGGQLWACLDTGGTAPVMLQISNDVENITNPVGIAEAIAIMGIPSVYLATLLKDITVVPGASSLDIDIRQYASLLIFIFATPSGTAGPVIARLTQALSTNLLFAIDSFYATSELTNNNGFLALDIPVLGNFINIDNNHPTQNFQMVVYGTNRPTASASAKRWLGYAQLPRRVNNLIASVVIGQIVPMPIVDLPSGAQVPNQMSFNGLFEVNGSSNAAGTIFLYYLDPTNTMIGKPLQVLAAAGTIEAVSYFEGYARMIFVPSVNIANLNVGVIVTGGVGI